MILIKLKNGRLCFREITLMKWSSSKSFSKCPKELPWKMRFKKRVVPPSWFNHSSLFSSSPSPRNRVVRQRSSTRRRDFLVVIEMCTPNPTEISSAVASAMVSKLTENYCLARAKSWCAFSRPHMVTRTESLRTLSLLPFAQMEGSVLLQPRSWNCTPHLACHCKQWAVAWFSFFTRFHIHQSSWVPWGRRSLNLEQIQVLVWLEKSQENLT